jgi:hypothetical protein
MKKSELRQIIREEIQSEIFGLFGKKPTPPPTKSTTQPKPQIDINTAGITVEGIDALGNGYTVWSGNNPMGDIRHTMSSRNEFGNITIENINYRYYIVNGLIDRVGRQAYFTVSTPNPNIPDEELKRIADFILKRNKDNEIKYKDYK